MSVTCHGDLEISFHHAGVEDEDAMTLVNIEFSFSGDREWDYIGASWRDTAGCWHDTVPGEWLDRWAYARLFACDPAEIEARVR